MKNRLPSKRRLVKVLQLQAAGLITAAGARKMLGLPVEITP